MKSHEQYAALLDAFIDGALSEQDAARVREHLAVCPDCQSYVSDALAMRELFPGVEETEVPEGFAESVMSALPAQRIAWRKRWKQAALPLAACIAAALLLRGLYVLPMGATGGAAPERAPMDMDGNFAEYEESASEDADEFEITAVASDSGTAQDSAASQEYASDDNGAQTSVSNGAAFKSAAADSEVSESQSDAAARYSSRRADDADTMPPQASEPSEEENASYRAISGGSASLQSAEQSDAGGYSGGTPSDAGTDTDSGGTQSDAEAPLGAAVAASGATEAEAPAEMEAAPAVANANPAAETEGGAVVTEAAPEFTDALGAESLSVSVWTLSADAAPIMERYPPDAVTPDGVWYALTPTEFDDLCERFPDIEITSGPETMDAASLPDGAPPLTYVDALYLFVPNP